MFNLKKFRKDHKLTQTDLAFMFECGQPNIVSMEKEMKDLTPKQKAILIEKYGDINSYYEIVTDSQEENDSNKWEKLAYQQQAEIERLISLLEEEKKENVRLAETVRNLIHLLSNKKAAI